MELIDKVLVILGGALLLFMVIYVIVEQVQKIKKRNNLKDKSDRVPSCKTCKYGEEMEINHEYYRCSLNSFIFCKPGSCCSDFCFDDKI